MVDIQSPTAENRRGKRKKIEDRRRNHRAKMLAMSACATQGGHKYHRKDVQIKITNKTKRFLAGISHTVLPEVFSSNDFRRP